MKAFRRLFGQKNDQLIDQADSLVRVAYATAVSAFGPILDKFPVVQTVYLGRENQAEYVNHFDFMMTVACVFLAVEGLRKVDAEEARTNAAVDRIELRLTQWNATDSIPGFEHCKNFFTKEYEALAKVDYDPKHIVPDAVGSWVVSDILQKSPVTEEERRLVRAVGAMIAKKFSNWWD